MNNTSLDPLARATAAIDKLRLGGDEAIGVKLCTDSVEGKSISVAAPLLNQPPANGIFFTEPRNFKPVKNNEKETHLQAIRREIEEETGLKLDIKEINFHGTC